MEMKKETTIPFNLFSNENVNIRSPNFNNWSVTEWEDIENKNNKSTKFKKSFYKPKQKLKLKYVNEENEN